MSFLGFTTFFSRTPAEAATAEPPVANRTSSNEVASLAERRVQSAPPEMPRRSTKADFVRARSLTKVFNQLPLVLPDHADIQVDVLEWYCHICLLETDPVRLKRFRHSLEKTLADVAPRQYGRLYNRLQICALWNDVCKSGSPWEEGDDDDDNESVVVNANPLQWRQMQEQLVLLKSYMLRRDADLPIDTLAQVSEQEAALEPIPKQQADPDGLLENHDMFQTDYQQVVLLFKVQHALASFIQGLEKASGSRLTEKTVVKRTEDAIDAYENSLGNLFDQDEESSIHIPNELTAFLLKDLYQKSSRTRGSKKKDSHSVVAQSLRKHALGIVSDGVSEFSHGSLKQKLRSLLIKWTESILEIPALVQLGYGGVTNPVIETEGDDVSSFGDDGAPNHHHNHHHHTHHHHAQDDHEEPLMTQAAAERRGSTHSKAQSNVTAEELVMMQKLNETAPVAPPRQRTVEKMPRSAAARRAQDGDDDETMEPEPLLSQAPVPDEAGYTDRAEAAPVKKLAAKVPTHKDLMEATQVVFDNVTDLDALTLVDFFKSLRDDYGFVMKIAQRNVVEKRLTELVNASNEAKTRDVARKAGTPAKASANAQGGETTDIEVSPAKDAAFASPTKLPNKRQLMKATLELFEGYSDAGNVTLVDIFRSLRSEYGFKLSGPLKKLVVNRMRELLEEANGNKDEPLAEASNTKKRRVKLELDSDARRNSSGKKEVTLKRLYWSDDSDDDDEELQPDRWKSAAKKRRKVPENRKTGPFSAVEIAAIREGVATHGLGKWTVIIKTCGGRLLNRTGPQVKDKYRNMEKAGQIHI